MDVEATRSIRQAEVGSVRKMLDRIKDRNDLAPERLIAPSRDIAARSYFLRQQDVVFPQTWLLPVIRGRVFEGPVGAVCGRVRDLSGYD